ncbi:hypothetical protein [Deinococcus yunweiensis]|uniref:hypothetical protein n=1 Tax=Deinococcus yunweiensis TaxID=367282 RepID=UPI00398F190D
MLKSELARQVGIDPSVLSKRLAHYRAETHKHDQQYLDDETIRQFREANDLLTSGQARTWKDAVLMVLGRYAEPVPSEGVIFLVQKLDAMQSSLDTMARQVEWMYSTFQSAQRQQDPAD